MTDKPLTPKQEAFCLRFIELGNASEAYRLSYNASRCTDKTIWEKASILLADGKVSARVNDLRDRQRERQLKRHDITVDKVLQEFARLAFLDIRKAFDADGNLLPIHDIDEDTAAAISGLEIEARKQPGEEVAIRLHKLKLSDKKAALDSLAKHLGMFVERTETKLTLDGLTDEQLDTNIALSASKAGVSVSVSGEGTPEG